jgi:uncharacterized protein (DUF983 family)
MSVYADDDDDDDGWDDDDLDSEADDPATIPCPFCGDEIYDDTPRCPACGRYLSAEDQAAGGKPAWVIATAVICLGVALWWVLGAW